MKKIVIAALLVPMAALAQSFPSPTFNSLTLQNPLTAANGGTGTTTSTGSGSVVLSNSPTLTAPNLGTPSAALLANATGLPVATGISGLGAGVASGLGNAATGSGSPVLATSPSISSPSITGGSINNASIGSTTPSTGAFTTLSSSGLATLTGVTTPSTGQFYQNLGATVNRVSDRLFVGPAVLNNGTSVVSQPDWFTTYQLAKGRSYGYVMTSQLAVLNGSAAQDSLTTLVAAAQTAGRTASQSQVIGVTGVGVNNNSGNTGASGNAAWGGYFEGWRDTTTAGNGGAYGIEVDSINLVGVANTDPYSQSSDQTISVQIASGGEIVGASDATAAINIQNNGAAYRKGIVFGSNSISGATGTSGTGVAIAFGKGHELQWYGATSTPTSSIVGLGTTTAGSVQQQFSDNSVQWVNSAGQGLFLASNVTNAVNFVGVSNATTGNTPAVAPQGADANIQLLVAGKGTSGAAVQGTTNGGTAPTGYIGQIISSDVPSPGSSVTSGAIANVTSASVPAGAWMCYGNVQQTPGASTAIGQNSAWISTTSAATPSALESSGYAKRVTVASGTASLEGMNVGPVFYNFTSTTTVYLSSSVNYSSGTTGTQYGALNCVRFH
ncbi:hypothetical protein J2801_003549 [Paraburkholderia phenoliruptrix]|uniref:beta strand repeat-containing protein n=1 Tax=Paraburkholderia phenoliruptrix TaxID=252970 RepID=UPI002858DF60|nr:hypothetical protein [Paraburkholderia phenoliruptrix]MDR6421261.1 hypothetical protein [Paraburkholderia phenoliruptrix]